MKNISFLMFFCLCFSLTQAQTTFPLKYQTVVKDQNNRVYKNEAVKFRFSIYENPITKNVKYIETHAVTTSDMGIVYLNIGGGQKEMGNFDDVEWSRDDHGMKVELDIDGGSNYADMGEVAFQRVPYAIHAETATHIDDADADPRNELQELSINGSQLSITGGNTINIPTGGGSGDDDPNNEIQTLTSTKTGSKVDLGISLGGQGTSFDVSDLDADTTNELQTLELIGYNLTISEGNNVFLDALISPWSEDQDDIEFIGDEVFVKSPNSLGLAKIDYRSFYIDNQDSLNCVQTARGIHTQDERTRKFTDVHAEGISISDEREGDGLILSPDLINMTIDSNAHQLNIYGRQIDIIDTKNDMRAKYAFDELELTADNFQTEATLNISDLTFDDKTQKRNAVYALDQAVITNEQDGEFSQIAPNNIRLSSESDDLFQYSYAQTFTNYIDSSQSLISSSGIVFKDTKTNPEYESFLDGGQMSIESNQNGIFKNYNASPNSIELFESKQGKVLKNLYVTSERISLSDTNTSFFLKPDLFQIVNKQREKFKMGIDHNESGYMEIMNDMGTPIIELSVGQDKNASKMKLDYGSEERIKLETDQQGSVIQLVNGINPVVKLSNTPEGGFIEGGQVKTDSVLSKYSLTVVDDTVQPTQEIYTAATHSNEVLIICRGTGQLINGEGIVYFPHHFENIANGATMTVTVTPLENNTYGLAVTEKLSDGFRVEELMSKTGNFEFDWEVKCVRKGEENFSSIRLK